jgi:hypothetical protein
MIIIINLYIQQHLIIWIYHAAFNVFNRQLKKKAFPTGFTHATHITEMALSFSRKSSRSERKLSLQEPLSISDTYSSAAADHTSSLPPSTHTNAAPAVNEFPKTLRQEVSAETLMHVRHALGVGAESAVSAPIAHERVSVDSASGVGSLSSAVGFSNAPPRNNPFRGNVNPFLQGVVNPLYSTAASVESVSEVTGGGVSGSPHPEGGSPRDPAATAAVAHIQQRPAGSGGGDGGFGATRDRAASRNDPERSTSL